MPHRLIGGSVTYSETRKIGDYESRKVDATLHYDDPEGGITSHVGHHVMALAKNQVLEAHGLPLVSVPAISGALVAQATDKDKLTKAAEKKAGKKEEAAPPAADPLALPGAPSAATSATPVPSVQPDDPVALTPTPADPTALPAQPIVTNPADLFVGTAAEITDVVLYDGIMKKNAASGNQLTDKIRVLIGKYTPVAGNPANMISQDKRNAFLLELAAMQ